jgi:hypothetical protein
VVHSSVACGAERNQVLLRVVSGLAAEFLVVNFQVGHRATRLASPAIPLEYLVAKLFVQGGNKPQPRPL